jgi:hypothetical protein
LFLRKEWKYFYQISFYLTNFKGISNFECE